jgi:hypothetical protein
VGCRQAASRSFESEGSKDVSVVVASNLGKIGRVFNVFEVGRLAQFGKV